MKVLLINGSPHEKGCTYTALTEVAKTLEENQIETEIFHIGKTPIRGCMGCGHCRKSQSHYCVFDDDTVNTASEKLRAADGLVVGSPVHYASAGGSVAAFLDRLFYAGAASFVYKPACAVVSCRRGGASATFDQLNKYFAINQMPIVTSQYWNSVHGNTPEEVAQDLEGLQTMRALGRNMAWLLKSIDAGRQAGLTLPQQEVKTPTNFIR